jgi:hypothetical protein
MIQIRCQYGVNLPRTRRRVRCLFTSLGFLGLLAERTPLGVSIIDATVIALGIDCIRPNLQLHPRIYIQPDHQSKHFLPYMFVTCEYAGSPIAAISVLPSPLKSAVTAEQ